MFALHIQQRGTATPEDISTIILLLDHGADLTAVNKSGKTACDICSSVLKEGNWHERKGLAILTVALKKFWDGSDAETRHREARQQVHAMSRRKFLYSVRWHRHVSSFLGWSKNEKSSDDEDEEDEDDEDEEDDE